MGHQGGTDHIGPQVPFERCREAGQTLGAAVLALEVRVATGIVDEHVDAVRQLRQCGFDGRGIGGVEDDGSRAQERRGLGEHLLAAPGDRDALARAGESGRDGVPDSRATAGHHDFPRVPHTPDLSA